MAARVLSLRARNRALLARQLLLERRPVPLVRALEQVGGLQTQYAPSGYLGLWSRIADFERDALTRALEQRRVVQATLMRSTIHMVSVPDFRLFSAGVSQDRREWWLRASGAAKAGMDMTAAAAVVRESLAEGPRRAKELEAALASAGFPKLAWQGAGLWVDLVRVPPSGTWARRRADLYGLAEQWVGPPEATRAAGLRHLLLRYLRAFGPAPLSDAATWAGVPLAALHEAVSQARLRRFADEEGAELLDVPRGLLPDPDTPAPVRLLPTWDATLLVHARRTGILPEDYRSHVFSIKNPQSVPTFVVDGQVAGSWRFEAGAVTINPFDPLPVRVRRDVEAETERVAAFLR